MRYSSDRVKLIIPFTLCVSSCVLRCTGTRSLTHDRISSQRIEMFSLSLSFDSEVQVVVRLGVGVELARVAATSIARTSGC